MTGYDINRRFEIGWTVGEMVIRDPATEEAREHDRTHRAAPQSIALP